MGAEPWRVAQITADGEEGESFRGSGYLIGPCLVLTAAHVLAGALAVRVLLDAGGPGEAEVWAVGWWADARGEQGTDLAVVMIPADVTADREAEPALFGRISDSAAVLAVHAVGFPLFKLRGAAGPGLVRDAEQVTGHVPAAANRRQGTLAVYLDDPPPAGDSGGASPWEGISGAAVWAGDRIIGVVAEHHRAEGAGRLTARRIDRAYDQLPGPDLARLAGWLGLAPAAGQLPDVVPAEPGALLQSAYLEQVREIAPDQLIGREAELAEWAQFCAGSEPYAWWQAGPWAGKSALASWFVTHPPAGLDIISFFITRRLAGQADSNAFLDAMNEQLAALVPAGARPGPAAGARAGVWLSLLAGAAARAHERGRRLAVVVDGLDEDEAGASPPLGRPSIASLLPRRPPPGARFIITSRPDPGLPDDVPPDHLLHTCTPRPLPVSQVAEDTGNRARQELQDLLTGDQVAVDVVGYITGSGGGLTRSDLSAMTGASPYKLDPLLRGVSGRSLQTRASAYASVRGPDPAARVYLFAHETLRVTAEEQLGSGIASYRQEIHAWIGSFASQGWPGTTPGYAVRGYTGLLTATGDTDRLSALARDPARHAFLLRATGNDYAALTEIRDAQQLIAASQEPDLSALVELAVYRHALSIRNQAIPVSLPAVWARLGHVDHAEAIARTITSPDDQARALTSLAEAVAQGGDHDRATALASSAEAIARTITSASSRAQALATLAEVAAQAGDHDRAEAIARTITKSDSRARALTGLAVAVAQAGDHDRAEAIVGTITSLYPSSQVWALTGLAIAVAQAGDHDRAEAIAGTITGSDSRAWALTRLAEVAAQAGDHDRAEAIAGTITLPGNRAQALASLAAAVAQAGDHDRAEAIAGTITDAGFQARALASLAVAVAQAGDHDRAAALATSAEATARTITDPGDRARALTRLAEVAAQAGDHDRATALATSAEAIARTITSADDQARALTSLAAAVAQARDYDRAEAIARTSPDDQARALTRLAEVAAQAGDHDRATALATSAEATARTITSADDQARALASLAAAVAQAGDHDRAEAIARTITSPPSQARALTSLAAAVAQAGDHDRAAALATSAEATARTITSSASRAEALASLAAAVAQAGDDDRAEAIARTITSPPSRARALASLAAAVAQAGDYDRAEAIARTITDPGDRARALTRLAEVAAQAGDHDRATALATSAEATARTITSADDQARALASLAAAAAQAGDHDRAAALVASAEATAGTITGPSAQAWALASLAAAAAQAGDHDRAEAIARTITTSDDQAEALAGVAEVAARAGDHDRAAALVASAEAIARTITDPSFRARALASLAAAAAQAGDHDRAEAIARTITSPDDQARALASLAAAVAQAGDHDRAEAIARTITSPPSQARALASLAAAVGLEGKLDRTRHLLALAIIAETSDISSWSATVARLFPLAIGNAADVFLKAYKAG